MSMATLLCNYSKSFTIPAGATPTTIDVPIDHATNWTVVLKNSGDNPVTGLSVSVSPLGSKFGAATSVTDGIPLAAGSSLAPINGQQEPCKTLRLAVTSTLGTTVDIEACGR